MEMEESAKQATPDAELERQIMGTMVPKNEREWWAWREISELRSRVFDQDEIIKRQQEALEEAREIAVQYKSDLRYPVVDGSSRDRRMERINKFLEAAAPDQQ